MHKIAVVLLLGVLPCAAQRPFSRQVTEHANYLAPFVTAPQTVVDKVLALADLKPGDVVYDLGSGDGRVLITAAQKYNVKGVGVEISDALVRASNERIKRLALDDRVKVIQGDVMNVDVSPADVVFLYLDRMLNDALRPHLQKSLRAGARVISLDFVVPGWRANRTEQIEAFSRPHTIYIYGMPQHAK